MFDVVTTSIYPYARYPGGPELEDRTLALKFFAGRHGSRAYPSTGELLHLASASAADAPGRGARADCAGA